MTTARELTYLAAISEALREEMRRDPNVLLMGEDIGGDFGGAFKVTKGFTEEFGEYRVQNMPMTELSFVGAATGMAQHVIEKCRLAGAEKSGDDGDRQGLAALVHRGEIARDEGNA